jgi:hypothetical protein
MVNFILLTPTLSIRRGREIYSQPTALKYKENCVDTYAFREIFFLVLMKFVLSLVKVARSLIKWMH